MKPQSDKNRKMKKFYIILIAVIIAAGVLLAVSLCVFISRKGELPNIVRSETLYVILALLLALPVLLVVLITAVLAGRKKGANEEVSDVVVKIDGISQPEKQEGKEEEEQEEVSRFEIGRAHV